MKLFLGVCLALAVAASAVEIGTPEPESPVFGYHTRFGIAEAARIKKLEEDAVFNGQRIVGGSISDISATPYQAGLVIQIMTNSQSMCGASIISTKRILTAAHCNNDGLTSANFFTVVLGSNTLFTGGTRISTSDIVIHPNWSPITAANDIAVLRLSISVLISNKIQVILLPTDNELLNDFNGVNVVASGYGLTSDGGNVGSNQSLSSVTLAIITNAECAAVFHNSNICTSSAAQVNSGGPLVVTSNNRRILVGVASYGVQAGYPATFTRVTSHVSWLQSQL